MESVPVYKDREVIGTRVN